MNHTEGQAIPIEQLAVGHYVYLDLGWMDHPFAFSHFKVKSDEQVSTLRSLGLRTIRISPEMSEARLMALPAPPRRPALQAEPVPAIDRTLSPVLQAKRVMIEQMKLRREEAARVERDFVNTVAVIRDIEKTLLHQPQETVAQATRLISKITDSILNSPELAIQIMGDKASGEDLYFHSLNVTMLALMMGRDLGLPKEVIEVLGVGALMHDVGRKQVPDKILLKTEAWTQAERNLYEMHCQFGVEIAGQLKLPLGVITIIREHHELFDGTGYPARLKGESIHLLARMVVIANYYDRLCNPLLVSDALTPHEALSLMYAKLRSKFDPKLLQVLIRCLGVYPPGTIVQLSNGVIGIVTSVNTRRPMKPVVLIYDSDVPKDEAMLLDMDEEVEFSIVKAVRPSLVPREIFTYLSPRKRVSYYFDPSSAKRETKRS